MNPSRPTYIAPNTVAIQATSPSRGSGPGEGADAARTTPTPTSSSPASPVGADAASRTSATASAVPNSDSDGYPAACSRRKASSAAERAMTTSQREPGLADRRAR